MITVKKLTFNVLVLTTIGSHVSCEDIRISKLDLDIAKLYLLSGIHQNCQPNPETKQEAPLCATMRTFVKAIDDLSKKGNDTIGNIILPIVLTMKKDLEAAQRTVMVDQNKVVVTAISSDEMELCVRINALIKRLESATPDDEQELNEEFNHVIELYQKRFNASSNN